MNEHAQRGHFGGLRQTRRHLICVDNCALPEAGEQALEDPLVESLNALVTAIRALVARSPVSDQELLGADELGELFRLSPRTLRDLASAGLVPHHRIGKHYRFSRDDISEILRVSKQAPRQQQNRWRAA